MKKIIATFSRVEEEMLDIEVSDDALERSACIVKEGGVLTVAFCSGLDTCPA